MQGYAIKVISQVASDADDLTEVLRETFRASDELIITSDPGTNTIIVRGSEADLGVVEAMVRRRDE